MNYFRQVFCKHKFQYEEAFITKYNSFRDIKYKGEVVYKRCEKCGYESSTDKWAA